MILRQDQIAHLISNIKQNPITALLGPRQCGKTTLSRQITGPFKNTTYFDLENPLDAARLENGLQTLEPITGLVILDEIQRQPELFKLLRVLADRRPMRARFLILGSASFELVRKSSESLAGRVAFMDIAGLNLKEVTVKNWKHLWFRGGFPRAYLAKTHAECANWLEHFIRSFLEKDLPLLGIRIPSLTLRKFWTMIAHYHGQIWNGSDIGSSLGVAHTTSKQYLDILSGALMIRQLPPWFENTGKRLVKAPKVYVRDTGILHSLLRIPDFLNLQSHPKLGASWEGFVIEQILSHTSDRNAYFWATHGGAELDLLLLHRGKKWGFEIKYSDAPTLTKSMLIAQKDLHLEHLWVVYPGNTSYPLKKGITCIGLHALENLLKKSF